MAQTDRFRVGDWVEVRSMAEILATLDKRGQLEGLPFMPHMFDYCGQRLRVYKSAHKTCDTVFPIRGRRMKDAVHLDTRCDGKAYGGCDAGCLIYWKTAWLKKASNSMSERSTAGRPLGGGDRVSVHPTSCTEDDVHAGTRKDSGAAEPVYVCQATQVPYATTDLNWWELSQYVEDYRSGNASLWRLFKGAVYSAVWHVSQAGIGLGKPIRWLYDLLYPLWRGAPFPRRTGTIPKGKPTPHLVLDLQPGEIVRVKSHQEILATLDTESKNRGLYFDAEAVPYCGGQYRVARRVYKIIDERTGKMLPMKTPSVVLEKVFCQSRYSECRMFCPRSIDSYWREIWLERVSVDGPAGRESTHAG